MDDEACASDPDTLRERCGDGEDNDGDGKIDCEDSECLIDGPCAPEDCASPEDEDRDGLVNCEDPDCRHPIRRPACSIVATSYCAGEEPFVCIGGEDPLDPFACKDNIDNDFDGRMDCSDPDCTTSCSCQPCEEICGVEPAEDDDDDGVIDEGCPCVVRGMTQGVCAQSVRNEITGECGLPTSYSQDGDMCGDGLDNDCDGLIDEGCPCDYMGSKVGVCQDGVASGDGGCGVPATYSQRESGVLCDDELDNDCDGLTDANELDDCP